jgi:lipopolysaccharide exporter
MPGINTEKIAKSSLWLISGFGFKKVFQLIAQIFLVRLLTPEDFGVWGMVLVITQLAEIFNDSTIAGVLVQRGIEDKRLANQVYSIGVNVSMLIFIVQVIAGYFASQFFQEPLVFPLTAFTALVFLISAGSGSHVAVLQRRMQFRELSITDSVSSFIRFFGAIVLAIAGLGVWSFAIAEVISTLVKAFLKYWFSRYPFQYHLLPDRNILKDVGGFIGSLISINLAVYVNTTADNILTGRFLGARELGFYNMAYQLAMLPLYALSQVNRVNFSVISQKDKAEQLSYVTKALELCAVTSAPVYGVAYVVAPWVIPLVYGAEWQPVVVIFQIVLLFAYTRGFMAILGTALNALNYPQVNAAINWILIPISVPIFFIGLHFGGIQGLAISVAIAMGLVATTWFWIATCRVARWNMLSVARPVVLPSVATVISIWLAISVPLADSSLKYSLEPIIVVASYLLLITVASKGKALTTLTNLIQKAANKK